MTPERFAQVEEAFHRLSELGGEEQKAAFEQLQATDEELAAEVGRLLEVSASTWKLGDFGGQTGAPIPDLAGALDPAPMPERIGGFRIVEEIGRGGMGVVYLGVRDDDFHQRAAIKVVKRGMDTDEILDRMRHERRILASLEHPNIARLIDGGTTDDGRPYFAMEHIEGRNLLDWAHRQDLDLGARIRLFLEIASAVEYAHRNLVIHRDLKPSNILVTQGGTAKLLDFGIAKLLASDGELRTTTGELLLTPDYASPEQVLGEPLTTASDVYSLGVVLFELLTGRHPYRHRVQGLAGLYSFASKATVKKASMLVLESGEAAEAGPNMRPPQLARALSGDLDNILGMALRREPERRYPTVAELAEDLRRHLDFRPVKAHPETLGYRLGRFVRRQRLGVAAAGLVFLSLSGGIAGTSWQAHKANLARQQAEEQAVLARTVTDFMIEVFGEPDPGKHLGDEPKARDLLASGRDRLDDLEGQPELLSALALVIGEVYQKLGDHQEALELYSRSLENRRQRLDPPHADLIESLHLLADAERELGYYSQAEVHLFDALDQWKSLGHGDYVTLGILFNDLGATRHNQEDFDDAVRWLDQALELRQTHLGEFHEDTAQTLNNLAVVRLAQGETDLASELMRQALRVTEERLGPEHPESMVRRSNVAASLFSLGQNEKAVAAYEVLIETQRRVFGQVHHETGQSLINLGWILYRTERAAQAIAIFSDAVENLSASVGADHENTLSAILGRSLSMAQGGQPEEALLSFEEFFTLASQRGGAPETLTLSAYSRRGRLLHGMGRLEEAAGDFCRGLAIRVRDQKPPSGGEARDRRELEEIFATNPDIATPFPECVRRLADKSGVDEAP